MLDRPRFFPPDWRKLLDVHTAMGHLNADERELLKAIVAGGERWGITPKEAGSLLARAAQRRR
jgi:hypothetical protein